MSRLTLLRAASVSRVFSTAAGEVHACRDVSLELAEGELLVVRGPSGAGKTTLLGLLGGLDEPTSGDVWLGEERITGMAEERALELRRDRFGFVFQSFGLIPVLTAAENIEVPLRIQRMPAAERDRRVEEMLELVGLAEHGQQRPDELSGGQQQRVGLARALAVRPAVLFADEPTGQLDSATAAGMMRLIAELVRTQGVSAVVATHDPQLAARADAVVELNDGRRVA